MGFFSAFKKFDPVQFALSDFRKPPGAKKSDYTDNSNVAFYLKNLALLRTSLKAAEYKLISPQISMTIAQTLKENGLADTSLSAAITSGAFTIPEIDSGNLAGDAAKSLHELQGAITQLRRGATNPSLQGTAVSRDVISGAAQGLASGGVWGAVGGAIAGGISGRQRNRNLEKQKDKIRDAAAEASFLASPEHFKQNFEPLLAKAREETVLTSQAAQLSAESNIEAAGLRGTGVGAQRSTSASILPEIAAMHTASVGATNLGRQETTTKLGSPLFPPKVNDNLIQALSASAGIASQLLTKKKASTTADSSMSIPTIDQPVYDPNKLGNY